MVPAIMALLGDWNWYMPHWTARLLRVEGFRPRGAQTEAGD